MVIQICGDEINRQNKIVEKPKKTIQINKIKKTTSIAGWFK
jgi:hypothetical protein